MTVLDTGMLLPVNGGTVARRNALRMHPSTAVPARAPDMEADAALPDGAKVTETRPCPVMPGFWHPEAAPAALLMAETAAARLNGAASPAGGGGGGGGGGVGSAFAVVAFGSGLEVGVGVGSLAGFEVFESDDVVEPPEVLAVADFVSKDGSGLSADFSAGLSALFSSGLSAGASVPDGSSFLSVASSFGSVLATGSSFLTSAGEGCSACAVSAVFWATT